jgi:hypothetical protein
MKYHGIARGGRSALEILGPLASVVIRPHPVIREAMEFDGDKPGAVRTKLLVDTGAHRTIISTRVAKVLELDQVREETVVGISQKEETWPVFMMGVEIRVKLDEGDYMPVETSLYVPGCPPFAETEQHDGLLGRDVLSDWHFHYPGPLGGFLLEAGDVLKRRLLPNWRKTHPAPKSR